MHKCEYDRCSSPAKFAFRSIKDTKTIYACGKHIASGMDAQGSYIVVKIKKWD